MAHYHDHSTGCPVYQRFWHVLPKPSEEWLYSETFLSHDVAQSTSYGTTALAGRRHGRPDNAVA
jgi:hypothetical protein